MIATRWEVRVCGGDPKNCSAYVHILFHYGSRRHFHESIELQRVLAWSWDHWMWIVKGDSHKSLLFESFHRQIDATHNGAFKSSFCARSWRNGRPDFRYKNARRSESWIWWEFELLLHGSFFQKQLCFRDSFDFSLSVVPRFFSRAGLWRVCVCDFFSFSAYRT